MAGEVPISDVLCEAMEYLSKLGKNLRVRSESLKEKRIRRDKLKNSHAVQKAADKVLLICELSKKSLENVECEVRKVLSVVNDRYVDTKTKASSSKSQDMEKYQYFRHQSHKLKISKKVPVKHYLSVKVLARRMSKAMQNNYPVYFDCKLYRQRRKQQIVCRSKDVYLNVENDSEVDKTTRKDKECDTFVLEEKKNEKEESLDKDAIYINWEEKENEKEQSLEKDAICISREEIHNEKEELLDKDTMCRNSEEKENEQEILDKDAININNSKESTPISTTMMKPNEEKASYCSENYNTKKHSGNEFDLEKPLCVHDKEMDLNKNENNVTKSKKRTPKKLKRIRLIDDSSDSNEPIPNQITNAVSEQNILDSAVEIGLDQECDIKRRKLNASPASNETTSINNEIMTVSPASKETEKSTTENSVDTVQTNETENVRALIKCVNINKLLKTEALTNQDNKQKMGKVVENIPKTNKKDVKTKNSLITKSQSSSSDDDDYWLQKRKEVSAFKPKKCTIAISRLPKFSVKFLQTHSLRKITQDNMIIIELENSEKTDDVCKSKLNKINTVKKALLRDSESEKSDDNSSMASADKEILNLEKEDEVCNNKSKKVCMVKKALLRDSESEKSDDDSCMVPIVNDVIKETPTSTKKELENKTDKLKQSLLYETDSDGVEKSKDTSGNEKRKCSDTDTVENDKNELLNESGSDKIEDTSKQSQSGVSNPVINNLSLLNKENKESTDKESSQCKSSDDVGIKSPDIPKSPPKERRKSKSITPRSKRKHIMESMHAKKMLLTYSSSSDTEDEQLRNALKEIKDSLLKGISSDDDNVEKKVSKNHSSSDSDADILDKINMKKESLAETAESREDNESSQDSSKKIGRSRKQVRARSQNSDSQASSDKNIYGLTNLKSLMKNRRRVDSTSTDDKTASNSIRKSRKMPKAPLISEENMLNPESSSDAPSGAESDGPEEDLPAVELSGLNGSAVDHLAKDDLLGESDTSTSNNEKEEGDKNDSEDENNLKARRRKANMISSDSEVGSSRKKDKDVRLSDFEDSEDESSDAVKKGKRKKKEIDSDASVGSTSSNGSKRKRRRIKQLNDSDASGSDTENEGRNKHGRKNIRKVMGKNQLEEATKKAAREEKERIARIAERQKLYNNLEFDESGKPDEVVLEKVVLDFDPETKEPLIEVDRGLVKKLKPHQANGIKFMWNACFESVKRIKKDKGSGCILAHCMGLGKTLQVVSLTHTLLIHGDLTTVNRVLVVCPLSTVLNWVNEFKMWLKHSVTEYEVDVYELSRYKQNSERAFQLQQWFEGGGVCVLGYEMFRNLSADNPKKFKKKMLRHFQEALVDPGPDLVVCDEGHLLKNEKTSLSQSMNRVKTRRRIVLTGTPLQNNLKEYYCMVQFVKPNLLGKYNEYLNRFVNPITNGQYTDSTEHDIRIMKRRSHVLHKMLDGAVQRRDYGVLAPFLPPKHEYVLFITLTEVQIKLYQYYLDNYSRRPLPGKSSGFLFPDFQSLQRIWTHPLVLKYNSERYEIMQQKKREREEEEDSEGSLADFIDDDSTPDESSTEESSDDMSDASDDSRKKNKKKKSQKKGKGKDAKMSTRRGTRANPIDLEDDEQPNEVVEIKTENPTEWWIKLVTEDELEDMRFSHKLILLFDILRQCEAIGDKLLVFSQSLYSLDLIEHFLGKVDEATQDGRIDEKLGGHVGSWSPGVDYFRLDGSTSCENRSIWCKNFNREDNPRARLFLISTRAGGLGINLVAANRVVIFDVSWNPSHDVQSIFRVYRFGQKKPCYVYRFLAMGTMEEKIYERQVTKQAISKRVIDEQQIDRHYAENDLAELYKFEAHPPTPRPLPPLPKDRLFAEMLREHEAQIYKYHEHDSLLENKEEETLSEEERKAAWEDFENEKNRPPPAPFPSAWPMHNGMVPSLLAQQQQQLAYAALAAMLRKDMPNINDNQIRDMLPLIYNANPAMFGGYDYGLMQKMTEIYKYAPGAMMNPAMMNQVMNTGMNTAANVGGAVGGSSGLQYSPPWQRQHQQQQQMRLQQLMQHQNMGAKYYAGGLGSRDPVAMALQQQRAREIMAGEQRGRPRGRPPLARPAPVPPADVVDLDSD